MFRCCGARSTNLYYLQCSSIRPENLFSGARPRFNLSQPHPTSEEPRCREFPPPPWASFQSRSLSSRPSPVRASAFWSQSQFGRQRRFGQFNPSVARPRQVCADPGRSLGTRCRARKRRRNRKRRKSRRSRSTGDRGACAWRSAARGVAEAKEIAKCVSGTLSDASAAWRRDRNRRMRCPLLVCSALAIGAVVCFGSDAHARERPVFCDPPTVTVVARGAFVGGKLCNGPWGCRCTHWFCPQCSTLPTRPVKCPPSPLSCATGPLSCEWTTCAPLYRPPARARR